MTIFRNSQRAASVLAALVFVALLVILIATFRIAMPEKYADRQPTAAAASAGLRSPDQSHIMIAAEPPVVAAGEQSEILWISRDMETCSLASLDIPDFSDEYADSAGRSGHVLTPPLTQPATIEILCLTKTGEMHDASVRIEVAESPSL